MEYFENKSENTTVKELDNGVVVHMKRSSDGSYESISMKDGVRHGECKKCNVDRFESFNYVNGVRDGEIDLRLENWVEIFGYMVQGKLHGVVMVTKNTKKLFYYYIDGKNVTRAQFNEATTVDFSGSDETDGTEEDKPEELRKLETATSSECDSA
jgi:hypothetical protein